MVCDICGLPISINEDLYGTISLEGIKVTDHKEIDFCEQCENKVSDEFNKILTLRFKKDKIKAGGKK